MLETIGKIVTESLQDNATGRYSSSRVIALLVAFAATVFMWKLVILGGMTIEYFTAYLLYGTGSMGVGKFFDNRDVARHAQAEAALQPVDEDMPKPPKV